MDFFALLPDPKGLLLDHLPTAIAEANTQANKEVLKAVAEAKEPPWEPQKKGPYVYKIHSRIQGKSC